MEIRTDARRSGAAGEDREARGFQAAGGHGCARPSFEAYFIERFEKGVLGRLGLGEQARVRSVRAYADRGGALHADIRVLTARGTEAARCELIDGAEGPELGAVRPLRGAQPAGVPLDGALVPIPGPGWLDRTAEEILDRYFPGSGRFHSVIDPDVLAARCGLTVERARIDPDGGVLGKLFFTPAMVPRYEGAEIDGTLNVRAGTIVLNREPYDRLPEESERFTVAHECAHWILHRQAFSFLRAAGIAGAEEACRRCVPEGGEDGLTERIERQANGLAARILMPAWAALAYANTAPARQLYTKPRYRAELAVDRVAKGLRVSRRAAKIRLQELGFPDAALAYPGLERRDVTAAISPADAARLYAASEPFRRALSAGAYVYAGDMFARADPEVLSRGTDGALRVTGGDPRAFLRFRYARRRAFGADAAMRAYVLEPGFVPGEELDAKAWRRRIADINRVRRSVPRGFGEALTFYMKRQNLSVETLAERSDLAARTVSKWRNAGEERPPIEIAMALCVGLRLPNVLAEDLLGKAGHVLRDTDTDMAYRMILDSMTANSIHEVNRVLRDMRMEPLTGPKTA